MSNFLSGGATPRRDLAQRLLQLVLHPVQLEPLALQHAHERGVALAAFSELAEEVGDALVGGHIDVESHRDNAGKRPGMALTNRDR